MLERRSLHQLEFLTGTFDVGLIAGRLGRTDLRLGVTGWATASCNTRSSFAR
jgi:hypothetical protein